MANTVNDQSTASFEPGLFFFEGLAVQIVPPAPPAAPIPGQLDFSKKRNSAFLETQMVGGDD